MAVTTGAGVPAVIEAGGTYIFTEGPFSNFPVGTWTCDLVIQIPGGDPVSKSSATSGDAFLFTLNTTDTADFAVGRNTFALYVTETSSGQRTKAKTGVLQVIPDLTQKADKSDAQTMLEGITAAIKKLTSNQFTSVSVAGVSYTRADVASMISTRTRLQAEVIRERQAADAFRGIETSGRIGTRFV